jgi:hypothetical protein
MGGTVANADSPVVDRALALTRAFADGGSVDENLNADMPPVRSASQTTDLGAPSPQSLIDAPVSQPTSWLEDVIQKAREYTMPRAEDYRRGAEGPSSLVQQGVENMRSGEPWRMLAGAGQDVLGTVSQPFAPIAGAMEAAKGSAERTFGPAAGQAVDVASNLNPDFLPTALAKAAHYSPELAMAGMGMKAANPAVDLAKSVTAAPRVTNDVGLYSHGAEAAAALPQAKGTPDQFKAMLQKAGVKPAEFENSGYDQAFAGQPSITRDQVVQHFQDALPKVEEKVLGHNPDSVSAGKELAESQGNDWDELRLADQNRYIREASGRGITEYAGDPKFQKYTIPDGENYREVLLKSPNQQERDFGFEWFDPNTQTSSRNTFASQAEAQAAAPEGAIVSQREIAERNPSFKSSHWDDPNVLAHLRMADRTGPNGEKILHIEEIQSDWGQKGRKEGFRDQQEKQFSDLLAQRDQMPEGAERDAVQSKINEMGRQEPGVPSAPYVTNTQQWTDLALKRALKEAAEGGYDKMVWTPGAEQAKRYSLTNTVSRIGYEPATGELYALDKSGAGIPQIERKTFKPEELPGVIGKDVAEKLLATEPNANGLHVLNDQEIPIGGEGMKSYYDKIVPGRLKELTKKLDSDAKIEPHVIRTPKGDIPAQSIRITPQMRERILKGLPAFKRGGSIVDRALNLTRGHQR